MYQGFFINLERNRPRRDALARHLAEIGAASRYERFEAVDGSAVASRYPTTLGPGALGCWLSHLALLEAHRATAVHLHIVEDDVVFARGAVKLFEFVLPQADALVKDWDLLFTEIIVPPDVEVFRLFHEKMMRYEQEHSLALLPLEGIKFAGTSSYFINQRSVEKVAGLLAGTWALGVKNDLYLRRLVRAGALKALVTVPFLTSLSRESVRSDIDGTVDLSHRVFDVYRRAFFKEADLPALLEEMKDCTREVKVHPLANRDANLPPLVRLHLNLIRFVLSEQMVPF